LLSCIVIKSIFIFYLVSLSVFCLRLAVRASVAPTVWRWSAAVAGVGAFAVAGLPWVGLLSTVSVCRGGQDRSAVVAVAVRLAPRLYGRGGRVVCGSVGLRSAPSIAVAVGLSVRLAVAPLRVGRGSAVGLSVSP
jgi:hypothetical protein